VSRSLSKGVREKLRRAELHRKAFEGRAERFLHDNTYQAMRKSDPETGQHVWIGKVRRDPPLVRWGALIGDCLFNYRSALDNLAYDLSIAYSGHPLPAHVEFVSEFPIFWRTAPTEAKLHKKIGAIDPEARKLITEMQPYGRRDRQALKYLDALQNHDKHRTIHLVQAAAVGVGYYIGDGGDPGINLNFSPFIDGDVIARADAQVKNDPVFTFGIAFAGEGPGRGYEVNRMLGWISQHIANRVIPPLVPYLRPQRQSRP
jgi:hypothetical protein